MDLAIRMFSNRRFVSIISIAIIVLLAYGYSAGGLGSNADSRKAIATITVVTTSKTEVSHFVTEYILNPDSLPNAIAVDVAGNVWFVQGKPPALAELSPANGTVHQFRIPSAENGTFLSWGIFVDNQNGRVWFTDQSGDSVWVLNVHSRSFARFALRGLGSPYQIAGDQKGNVWFTEVDGNRLGEITQSGSLEEFSVPLGGRYNLFSQSTGPAGLAIAGDGAVWFTEVYADSIGVFSRGQFQSFDLSGKVQSPTGLAIDSSGRLWITEHASSFISEFDPKSDQLTTFSTSNVYASESLPYFVLVDSSDNVWFNEHYGNAIAKFVPSNGSLLEYRIPSHSPLDNLSGAYTIALSPSGQLWFTEAETGKIGTVNFQIPTTLHISVSPSSVQLQPSHAAENESLGVSVAGTGELGLKATVGGNGSGFGLGFSPQSGTGSFASTLTIVKSTPTLAGDAYTVTISAVSQELVVSRIIYLKA
jgi:virginiamycin B lyase